MCILYPLWSAVRGDSFSVRKLTNEEVGEVLMLKIYLLTHFSEMNEIYQMETFTRALCICVDKFLI